MGPISRNHQCWRVGLGRKRGVFYLIHMNRLEIVRRSCFATGIFLLCSILSFPMSFKAMAGGFLREVQANGKLESAKGTIYYLSGKVDKIILKIVEPVDQWMVFEGNTLLIFYPNSNQAFKIESRNPFILPFFQFLLDLTKEDFGLSARGFRLSRYEKQRQRLISHWTPPKELIQIIGEVVLTHQNDALLNVQTKDPKGIICSDIVFDNHVSFQGVSFPLQIRITTHEKDSSSQEAIVFRDLEFNQSIPADILNFAVPAGAITKNVKW